MKSKNEYSNKAYNGKQSYNEVVDFDYSKSPYKVSLWKTMFKQYWKMMSYD